MTEHTAWTDEEIALLKKHSNYSLEELSKLLPGRSSVAVSSKRLRLGIIKREQTPAWTQKELAVLREHGNNTLVDELALLLPRHSKIAIAARRRRLGIILKEELISRMRQLAVAQLDYSMTLDDLDGCVFQVLIGSMLGDGCVSGGNRCKNYRFGEAHCDAQEDYARWKVKIFNCFKPKIWKCKYGAQFNTKTHPIFTVLRSNFYREKTHCFKSIIPMDLISKLDFLGIMIWYLDDGTNHKGRASIMAKGYSVSDLTEATEIMNEKLGLTIYVRTCDKNGSRIIYFGRKSRDVLFSNWRILADKYKLPSCMYYKFGGPT